MVFFLSWVRVDKRLEGVPAGNLSVVDLPGPHRGVSSPVKLFYTGPVVTAETLVMMLEKHGISATQEFVEAGPADEDDLNRPTKVLVPEADYDRAYRLFYAEREDEL